MRTFLLLSLCATVVCLTGGCGGTQPAPVSAPTPEVQKVAPAAVPIQPATPPAPAEPITVAAPVNPTVPAVAPPVAVPTLNFDVVKAWDFTKLEDDKLEWAFPGGSKNKTKTGAVWFGMEKSRPGPMFKKSLSLSASDITHVRITTHVTLIKDDKGSGHRVNYNLIRLHWAGPEDIASKPDWPYDNSRSIHLKVLDPAQPRVWTGKLAGAPLWQGTVDQAFFALDTPDDQLKAENAIRFNVIVDKIEFLKERP